MDVITEFKAALSAAGYRPKNDRVDADNHWYRLYFMDEKGGRDSGRYCLRVLPDGFAFGSFGSDKDPAGLQSWHSRKKERMTAEDRAAFNARYKAERAAAEAERQAGYEKGALEAQAYWRGLQAATGTEYSARKGVEPEGARQDGDRLIVPVYADGKLWSVQEIRPDGSKQFRPGCRASGGYCPLATKHEDKSRILIVEGWATGCTVRAATGLPTIIAFNAGNLMAVAQAIKRRYPEATILIIADNDQWTVNQKGEPWNPGREKANQAAGAIGGAHVVWPEFPSDDPDRRTDFNDLHISAGLEAVRTRILSVAPQRPEETPDGIRDANHHDLQPVGGDYQETPDNFIPAGPAIDWRELAIWKRTAKGDDFLDPDKSLNYGLLVEHLLSRVFAFDEFRLSVIMVRCPPWMERDEFRVHEIEDSDVTEVDYWLQKKGLNGNEGKTRAAVYRAALLNPVHPARDYFNRLQWDGVARLDNWLIDICGAENDDPDYLRAAGSKWMIAGVKRVFEPGCQFDHMLILEGGQAAYKSSTLRALATFGDPGMEEEYFTDTFSIKNHKDKDELLKLWGCLIIEIGEMAGFGDADIEAVKNFITIRSDKVRLPYTKLPKVFRRQFIFAGTRNPTGGLFTDPTGNRRFWPVEVGQINFAMLKRDKDQLWAEAVHRFKSGESLQLSNQQYQLCAEAAQARRIVDDWTHDVMEKVGNREFITVREILKEMGLPLQNITRRESIRVQDILKSNAYEYKRKWAGKKQIWGWRRVETQLSFKEPDYEEQEEVEVAF